MDEYFGSSTLLAHFIQKQRQPPVDKAITNVDAIIVTKVVALLHAADARQRFKGQVLLAIHHPIMLILVVNIDIKYIDISI
jgi:hypothetical protein